MSWHDRSSKYSKLIEFVLSLIVISIPAVVAYCLVTFLIGGQVMQFVPQLSDEIFNWHQISTFLTAGFNGGYYTVNEQPAAASFSHFYSHGPVFPVLIGSMSLVSVWDFSTIFFVNVLLLTGSLLVFIVYTKPDRLQLILIGFAVLTFWPAHLYMASCMRQVFFDAFSVLVAAFFYHAWMKSSAVSRRHLILLFITILLMSLSKLTNSILFLPFFLAARERFGYTLRQAVLMAVGLISISIFVGSVLVAPYPVGYVSELQATFSRSFGEGVLSFLLHAFQNIESFLNYSAHPLWVMLRAQLLLTFIAGCWIWWKQPKDRLASQYGVLILATCAGTAVGTILFYDVMDWRDFRLFSPIVLMITLLFIAKKQVLFPSLIVVGNLMVLPAFIQTYSSLMTTAFPEKQTVSSIEAFTEKIAPVIRYDKDADGWGNTLLAPLGAAMDRRMLGVPAGIGISWFTSPQELNEVKSRYLILDKENYNILKERVMLELKASTAIGDLYVNRSAKTEN